MIETNKPKINNILTKWFVLVGLFCSVISIIIFSVFVYGAMKNLTYQNLIMARDTQVMLINSLFEEKGHNIERIAMMPAVREKDLEKMGKIFKDSSYRSDLYCPKFVFVDTKGQILLDIDYKNNITDIEGKEYFKTAMAGAISYSEILYDSVNGKPYVIIACPVYSYEWKKIGAVIGTYTLEKLDRIVSSFQLGKTGKTYLIDENGRMLSNIYGEQLPANNNAIDLVIQQQTGYDRYENSLGIMVFGAYEWLPERNMGIIVEIDAREMLGKWHDNLKISIFIFLPILAVILYLLSKYLSRRITEPLGHISKTLANFADDYKGKVAYQVDFDKRTTYHEVSVLSQYFNEMSMKIGSLMNILEERAYHDQLTGLSNRHDFFIKGQEIITLAEKYKNRIALLFIDLDNFKDVNDTYGHQVGDCVLVYIAKLLEKNTRKGDLAARLGGEEFVLLLTDINSECAFVFAERLRKLVEDTIISVENINIKITISIGIAFYTGSGENINSLIELNDLIRRADTAMYEAKQAGRNRIAIEDEIGI